MRTAIIGCGQIAGGVADEEGDLGIYTHSRAYQTCSRTELVAICDADAARAEACARRWGVARWYTDPIRMMEEAHPDLVSLCSPDETHAPLTLSLLQAPCPPRGLFCEKPLALSVDDGRRVVEGCRAAGVVLAVNYFRRYLPNLRAVRNLLRSGTWGAVQAVQGWYTKGVLHNGTHWFDLVRFLLGEVARVSGRLARDAEQADPGVDVTLELADGTFARLTSCDARHFTVFEMDIMLEKGRLELREAALRPRLSRARPSARFVGYAELQEDPCDFGPMRDPLLHAVEDLVAALDQGRAPACTGEDALAALVIGEAALRSAREGGRCVSL